MSAAGSLHIKVSRKKVVFIRLDKIGDLICTLPVDQFLDDKIFNITWVVQKGLGPVVELGARSRKFAELDKTTPQESAEKFRKLLQKLKPDFAVSFQGPWWINFELFKARVPVRAGVYSQWHSFLFLNQGLRQKRSHAVQHEFDYNKDLVFKTFILSDDNKFHYFEIPAAENKSLLEKFNLTAKNYVVVHPGMMGSALNWTQTQYIEYIHQQISKNKTIVITGTSADEPYLNEIKKAHIF